LCIRSRTLQVQVSRMFPGEGDSTVHLYAVGRGLNEGIRTGKRSQADGLRTLFRSSREPGCGISRC
jgi:hypothetical protein